jgi:5-methylcytosine-specific restriction endonuclease McrA
MLSAIARYLNPWRFRRDQRERRLAELRQRDGDTCRRCRRPISFELPAGHDQGAKVEPILPKSAGGTEALDNLCLTHGRCNAAAGDDTAEVMERLRPKREAALFVKARKKRRAA